MIISSSGLYWLLKLDDFQGLLTSAAAVSGSLLVAFVIVALMALFESDDVCCKAYQAACLRLGRKAAWVLAVACVLRVLLPSTKQAAVICVVPAVMGSKFVAEEVPAEARELYGLAKRWLSEKAETAEKESK